MGSPDHLRLLTISVERAVSSLVCFTVATFHHRSRPGRSFLRGCIKQHDKLKGAKRVEGVCKKRERRHEGADGVRTDGNIRLHVETKVMEVWMSRKLLRGELQST